MKKIALAVAGLLGLALAPSAASAAVTTYTYTEADTGANITDGIVGFNVKKPFTFAFTVANALAANTDYGFGVAGAESGASGNVLDLSFSDGTPLTTFTLADFHSKYEVYGGGAVPHTLSRIGVHTNGAGAITTFSILMGGRTPTNPQTLTYLQFVNDGPGTIIQEVFYYDPALGFRTTVAGDVICHLQGYCGGAFVGTPGGIGGAGAAVPEPASWALMIAGFGAAGTVARRRRVAAVAV